VLTGHGFTVYVGVLRGLAGASLELFPASDWLRAQVWHELGEQTDDVDAPVHVRKLARVAGL
jgi:hypothetical protein